MYCFFFFFALPFSPSLPSFLSFLSLGVCYFSPVIRHADSSLSPSNTTKINFPALSHVGGPQWGTHLYMHFIYPHTRWNTRTGAHDTHTRAQRCKHAGQWFTTSLFSNVLLVSSLQHPFVFAGRSWQQHPSILPLPSLRQPTLNCDLLPLLNSILFLELFEKQGRNIVHVNGCYSDAACSRRARHWAPELSSADLWSVSVRTACDELLRRTQLRMVCGGESLRHALLVCLRPDSICGCFDWRIKRVMLC